VGGEIAQHVIKRSRAVCFADAEDRWTYLDELTVFAAHYECAVHAYVLMANHVHLLVTPGEPSGVSDLVQAVCETYRRYITERHGIYDSLWKEATEVRQVHARRYLLACMRYIELNPVRAGIVAQAEDFRWSSYRANALGYIDPIVTPHPLYYALGRSPEARRAAYARFVRRGFARPDIASP
jgi:REP-associated tyrosine transposase